jgi:hypothetical protein
LYLCVAISVLLGDGLTYAKLFHQQADSVDSVRSAKAATNEAAAAAQKVVLSQPFGVSQSQARDADVRALADLSRALDKKEALVVELRQMNDEANANCDGLRVSEVFQRQYATVVLQLKEANKQVLPFLFLGMDLSGF